MPSRLRPTAPIAADAILVGDPGRALLLAQELHEQPKMSNHARGLWGYTGTTPAGRRLTIQATGMGGPSAALVLGDLAKLGVRRAVRVGSCTALPDGPAPGEPFLVEEARSGDGAVALPDPELTEALRAALGDAAPAGVALSLDAPYIGGDSPPPGPARVADMQTAALLARGREVGVALAAVLIVAEAAGGERLDDEGAERAAKRAGNAAAAVF